MPAQILASAIAFFLCAVLSNTATAAAEAPPRSIRVLVVTGGHDFEHGPFFEMFKAFPEIEFIEARQPEAQKLFATEEACKYDVIVLYDFWQEISDKAKKDFVLMLQRGKGLVVLHHAMGAYQNWPEYQKIVGGKFFMPNCPEKKLSTYDHDVDLEVKIANPDHPIVAGMKDFKLHDEVYGKCEMLPGVDPILTTNHPKSDKHIAWTHRYGNSRVAFLQSGHDRQAYENPSFRQILRQSILWTTCRIPVEKPDKDGFVSLFNGKNLDGWTVYDNPQGFTVKDGLIRSASGTGAGWLRTVRPYSDFVLKVEWRTNKNGNSGVFVRAPHSPDPWITGMEIQISNEPRDEKHCTGSIYGCVGVDPRPDETADKWHSFEISCIGNKVAILADGVQVVQADANSAPELKNKPLSGYIGLQDSHNPGDTWIEFRAIRIKDLSEKK